MSEELTPASHAEKIVYLLRSDDPEERIEGLGLLFPGDGGAIMARAVHEGVQMAVTPKVDPIKLFQGALWLAQNLGKANGLELNWLQRAQESEGPGIIIPQGDFGG